MTPPPFVEELGREPSESLADRGEHWLRAHPVLVSLVVLLLIGAAVPLLVHHQRRPSLPQLKVSDDGTLPASAPWQTGPDGRPSGPVMLSVTAKLAAGAFTTQTTVLGIAGPGLRQVSNRPIPLTASRTVTVPLSSVVDCTSLPATVPIGAYRLRVLVRSGSRSRTGLIGAGNPGERWRTMVQLACAAWSARRDVTGSDLTASVGKTRPQADLRLTLTNTGALPVTVTAADSQSAIQLSGGLPIKVPAHGSAQAVFTVVLKRCDAVAGPLNQTSPLTSEVHLTSVINLVGLAGTLPLSAGTSLQVDGDGLGATGIVLDPAAGRKLMSTLNQACGQIAPSFAMIGLAPNAVRYQASSRVLTVPVTIFMTPGRVRSLTLRPESANGYNGAYLPLSTAVQHLVPDRTGQARTTLRFRAPAAGTCPDHTVVLPSILVSLQVVTPSGTRTVPYGEALDLNSDPHALPLLCPTH